MSQEQHSLFTRSMGAFAAVLVVLLAVGTFTDFQIAQSIYSPGNPVAIVVSALGLIPMAYPASFLLGVLAQRSLTSQKTQILRIVGVVLCVVLAALFGALITRAFLSIRDGFGGLVGAELSTTARMGIGAVVGVILCVLGYGAAKGNDAQDLARRVLIVVVVLAASFVVVEIVKNLMVRPRPWVVLGGYEGVEFSPWYNKTAGTEELMATNGLEKDAFKSFPSGHTVQAVSFLASFYGLSLVFPSLREKLGIALVAEIVIALAVMASRMTLGAHFLSDVSMGALVAVAAFLILLMLQGQREQGQRENK